MTSTLEITIIILVFVIFIIVIGYCIDDEKILDRENMKQFEDTAPLEGGIRIPQMSKMEEVEYINDLKHEYANILKLEEIFKDCALSEKRDGEKEIVISVGPSLGIRKDLATELLPAIQSQIKEIEMKFNLLGINIWKVQLEILEKELEEIKKRSTILANIGNKKRK